MSKEERLLLWTGLLASVIIACAMFIARMERWRKRQMELEDDNPNHIGSFRQMYENGEITRAEYERVMHRMAEKAKLSPKSIVPQSNGPAATSGPATSPEPPAPPT